jgi:hypothetical protein
MLHITRNHDGMATTQFSIGASALCGPGVEHRRKRLEIPRVAGDHGKAVALRAGHDQAIHHRQRPAGGVGSGGEPGPGMQGGGIERQDASGETLLDATQPGGEFLAARRIAGAQFENAFFDLAQTDHAEEQAGFVLFVQPGDDLPARAIS